MEKDTSTTSPASEIAKNQQLEQPSVPPSEITKNSLPLPVTFFQPIKPGTTNKDVALIQNFLEQKGLLKMPPTTSKGHFGSLTKDAVKQYQKQSGLPQTGTIDKKTMERMEKDTQKNK